MLNFHTFPLLCLPLAWRQVLQQCIKLSVTMCLIWASLRKLLTEVYSELWGCRGDLPLSIPKAGALCALQGAKYQLRLSLFDATYHHFFGRTWRSSWQAAGAAPPRSVRATFNEVGAAEGLGKHRTKPFSIPALPDLFLVVHPRHCPFIKLYVRFIGETEVLSFL